MEVGSFTIYIYLCGFSGGSFSGHIFTVLDKTIDLLALCHRKQAVFIVRSMCSVFLTASVFVATDEVNFFCNIRPLNCRFGFAAAFKSRLQLNVSPAA